MPIVSRSCKVMWKFRNLLRGADTGLSKGRRQKHEFVKIIRPCIGEKCKILSPKGGGRHCPCTPYIYMSQDLWCYTPRCKPGTQQTRLKSNIFKYFSYMVVVISRLVCPNFDTLPILRHSRFTHFVDAAK